MTYTVLKSIAGCGPGVQHHIAPRSGRVQHRCSRPVVAIAATPDTKPGDPAASKPATSQSAAPPPLLQRPGAAAAPAPTIGTPKLMPPSAPAPPTLNRPGLATPPSLGAPPSNGATIAPKPTLAPPAVPKLGGPPTNPFATPQMPATLQRPAAPAASPVSPQAPNMPGLQRPTLTPPAPPATGMATPQMPQVLPKPLQPSQTPPPPGMAARPTLQRQPALAKPPAPGATEATDGLLKKPDPPTLRVLAPLMPPPGSVHADAPARKIEIVEEDDGDLMVDEDDEGKGKGKGKKKGGARKEKVTAEMKRAARKTREAQREEKAAASRKDREEIFEVGDAGMSLEQLAEVIQVDASDIVRSLFMKGIMLSMNQVLDKNTCKVVAAEYGLLVVDKEEEVATDKAKKRTEFISEEDIDDLVHRPPVVTVMGHVDHGKTSLLDYIRKARVAAGEAGGITQGIGAYNTTVEVDGEEKTICFLDTPGHEAFSAMRARGAQVTDIAVIIVAADDGVRPQTREAVMHAQAAEVPIIVAINKIDKPGADVERVKQELLELNLVAEEWGGNTPMVPVSAKKGTGVADLLQMVSWVAEEKKLVANAKRPGAGTVIEAHLDRKVGPVATLLVQAGTLKVGDIVCSGASYGKVRTLRDDLGRTMDSAGPSIAVQLVGLNSTPMAGGDWTVVPNESAARDMASKSMEGYRAQRFAEMTGGGSMVTLSSLATLDEDSGTEALQRINLVIKGDTMGVVEAIKSALGSLPQQSVTLRYLLSGAGDISISDVDLAAASGGLLLGFNLEPDTAVEEHAKRLGVRIMTYKVIYDLIDDVKAAMEGKLKSVEERVAMGKAEVKAVFGSGKKKVAGCAVLSGKLIKGAQVSVKRGKQIVFEGKLSSLRRVKDAVEEVSEGLECGVAADDFLDWAAGDSIECYMLVTKSRRLEDAKASSAVDVSTIA